MQKGLERCENPRFRQIGSRALVKSASKVIIVPGFAVLDCVKDVSAALLAEKEISVIVKGVRYPLSRVDDPFFNRMPHLPGDDLLHILAKDSVVNAFIHESCIRGYSSIAVNPEVVGVLEKIAGREGLKAIEDWRSSASPYVVEFTVTLDELDTRNLIPDDEAEFLWRGVLRHKDAVFNNLVFQALMVCVQDVDHLYAFMPPGCRVPPSSIARITPLDAFCGSPEDRRDSMCDRERYCPICQKGK